MTSSRGLDPEGVDGTLSRSDPPDKAFLAGAAATFFFLLAAFELAARFAAGSGWLYRRFDFAGTLTSLPELRERIAWNVARPRPVFVLGDSVLGATALWEHRVPQPKYQTIPAYLARESASLGWSVESLGADGLLLPDLEALGREVDRAPPSRLLIVLNVRMFAPEFDEPAKALSRDFLLPALSGELPDPRMAGVDDSLDARLSAASARFSVLLRTGRQLQPLWYFPTRRDAFRRWLEPKTGAGLSADLEEAALRLKVDPYYRARWESSSLPFRALGALLDRTRSRGGAVVVLTPQNPDFVGDRDLFDLNRRVLREFIDARRDPSVLYRDFADRFPSQQFLDHCHLTPEGNREYAQALLRAMPS